MRQPGGGASSHAHDMLVVRIGNGVLVWMYVRTYVRLYELVCMYCMYACTCVCMHVRTLARACVRIYESVCMHAYTSVRPHGRYYGCPLGRTAARMCSRPTHAAESSSAANRRAASFANLPAALGTTPSASTLRVLVLEGTLWAGTDEPPQRQPVRQPQCSHRRARRVPAPSEHSRKGTDGRTNKAQTGG